VGDIRVNSNILTILKTYWLLSKHGKFLITRYVIVTRFCEFAGRNIGHIQFKNIARIINDQHDNLKTGHHKIS